MNIPCNSNNIRKKNPLLIFLLEIKIPQQSGAAAFKQRAGEKDKSGVFCFDIPLSTEVSFKSWQRKKCANEFWISFHGNVCRNVSKSVKSQGTYAIGCFPSACMPEPDPIHCAVWTLLSPEETGSYQGGGQEETETEKEERVGVCGRCRSLWFYITITSNKYCVRLPIFPAVLEVSSVMLPLRLSIAMFCYVGF